MLGILTCTNSSTPINTSCQLIGLLSNQLVIIQLPICLVHFIEIHALVLLCIIHFLLGDTQI